MMLGGRRTDRHPDDGVLRAYVDGELPWLAARRCARHLEACASCRTLLGDQEQLSARAAALLTCLEVPVNVQEGWRRLGVVSGAAAGQRPGRGLWRSSVVPGAAAVAGVLVVLLVLRSAPAPHAARILDACCWDLDGGGPGDDGVLTVTLPDQRVVALTVYEDRNHSRSLTPRDPVRYGSWTGAGAVSPGRDGPPAATPGTVESPRRLRDFCCADYDGGGPEDDGVLTVGRPVERVEEVVLYEDADGSGGFSLGDSVRWSTDRSTGSKHRQAEER